MSNVSLCSIGKEITPSDHKVSHETVINDAQNHSRLCCESILTAFSKMLVLPRFVFFFKDLTTICRVSCDQKISIFYDHGDQD